MAEATTRAGASAGAATGAGAGAGTGLGALDGACGAVRGSVRAGLSVAGRTGLVFRLTDGGAVKGAGSAAGRRARLCSAEAVGATSTEPGAARC